MVLSALYIIARSRIAGLSILIVAFKFLTNSSMGQETPLYDQGSIDLLVDVPQAFLPGDYWLYIDKHLAGHVVGKLGTGGFATTHRADGTTVFADDQGVLAVCNSDRFTYLRPNYTNAILAICESPFRLSAGTHEIELMVRREGDTDEFPFVISRSQATIDQNRGLFRILVPPPRDASAFVAVRAVNRSPQLGSDSRAYLTAYATLVKDRVHQYLADPLVKPLLDALDRTKASPPSKPYVYVELPIEAEGPRELDAVQLNIIVEDIISKYTIPPPENEGQFPKLDDLIKEYNFQNFGVASTRPGHSSLKFS